MLFAIRCLSAVKRTLPSPRHFLTLTHLMVCISKYIFIEIHGIVFFTHYGSFFDMRCQPRAKESRARHIVDADTHTDS